MARPPKPSQSAGADLDQEVLRQIHLRIRWLKILSEELKKTIKKESPAPNLMRGAMLWSAEQELADLVAAKKLLQRKQKDFFDTDAATFTWNQDGLKWREDNSTNLYGRSAVIRLIVDLARPDES